MFNADSQILSIPVWNFGLIDAPRWDLIVVLRSSPHEHSGFLPVISLGGLGLPVSVQGIEQA